MAAMAVREKQKHMKPLQKPVNFHFGSRPLGRTSHVALPRVKGQRNMFHHGETWWAGPPGRARNWGLSPTPP